MTATRYPAAVSALASFCTRGSRRYGQFSTAMRTRFAFSLFMFILPTVRVSGLGLSRFSDCDSDSSPPCSRLNDPYTDTRVPINCGYYFILHPIASNELFESSEFVEWAGKLVKQDKISSLKEWCQSRENKER